MKNTNQHSHKNTKHRKLFLGSSFSDCMFTFTCISFFTDLFFSDLWSSISTPLNGVPAWMIAVVTSLQTWRLRWVKHQDGLLLCRLVADTRMEYIGLLTTLLRNAVTGFSRAVFGVFFPRDTLQEKSHLDQLEKWPLTFDSPLTMEGGNDLHSEYFSTVMMGQTSFYDGCVSPLGSDCSSLWKLLAKSSPPNCSFQPELFCDCDPTCCKYSVECLLGHNVSMTYAHFTHLL